MFFYLRGGWGSSFHWKGERFMSLAHEAGTTVSIRLRCAQTSRDLRWRQIHSERKRSLPLCRVCNFFKRWISHTISICNQCKIIFHRFNGNVTRMLTLSLLRVCVKMTSSADCLKGATCEQRRTCRTSVFSIRAFRIREKDPCVTHSGVTPFCSSPRGHSNNILSVHFELVLFFSGSGSSKSWEFNHCEIKKENDPFWWNIDVMGVFSGDEV